MLDELKPIHIQTFYNQMYESGLSGKSVKHLHMNIRKTLQYAVKINLIQTSPADKTERPKCEKFTANFCNKDELTRLFKIFQSDRMELCVHIAAYDRKAQVQENAFPRSAAFLRRSVACQRHINETDTRVAGTFHIQRYGKFLQSS